MTVDPLWTPGPEDLTDANVSQFIGWLNTTGRASLPPHDYHTLWRWSIDDLTAFWAGIWDYFGILSPTRYEQVVTDAMPTARWFPGAQVSYVEHLFRGKDPQATAIIDVQEPPAPDDPHTVRTLTWRELSAQVTAVATTLRGLGVRRGDRVVGYVPNTAEAVVAFLAAASIGAIWAACGQDYSPGAAADRLGQLDPVVLIAADGYRYGGRTFDRRDATDELRRHLPTLRATIGYERIGRSEPPAAGVFPWPEPAADEGASASELVAFEHPLWVLFSSGTTGKPKGIVHSTGGVLIEHLKAMAFAVELTERDTFFWYTSPSWMVWNYLVSALLVGTRIVCYDGSLAYPSLDTLWDITAQQRVTVFGTSPAHLRASADHGLRPGEKHDLSMLRSVGSSGSALPAASYHWVAENVGRQVRINSTSGGTDVVSSFVGGSRIAPVWPGELSVPHLGVALDAWDATGRSLRGQVGELVVTKPMPSMPIRFWGDDDGSRYRAAYFGTYPGIWRHGDWITITERGSVIVHGRSDSTLNRNGIRMGSADIYQAVETMDEIAEALVIGAEQPEGGYWMPLFVVLNPGHELDEALTTKICATIREQVSPKHVPDEVIAAPAIPHTRTGKKLEIPIKRILQGAALDEVADGQAVDDPTALRWFAAIRAAKAP